MRFRFAAAACALALAACQDSDPTPPSVDAGITSSPPQIEQGGFSAAPQPVREETPMRPEEKTGKLSGKTIAILATDGVEQVELTKPRQMFDDQGARTVLVSIKAGTIQGFNHHDKGDELTVDMTLDDADAKQFDALVLPGGVSNPDALRMDKKAVDFVKAFVAAGKPIAAICHGPWTLIEAGAVRGHTMTSWPSLKTDLVNAGAKWVDKEVVDDAGLVTSRKPDDIPAFVEKATEEFAAKKRPPMRHAAR